MLYYFSNRPPYLKADENSTKVPISNNNFSNKIPICESYHKNVTLHETFKLLYPLPISVENLSIFSKICQKYFSLADIVQLKYQVLAFINAALQIRTGQWSITANLWPLNVHTSPVMIIVAVAFPRDLCFLINIIFIPYRFFWTILNLFPCNLNTLTKYKEQVCFLFIYSLFTYCFVIIQCIKVLHLSILFCCL